MTAEPHDRQTAAQLLVRSLVRQGVKYIFGIPGGKIMPTYDVSYDEGPELIVCRHEPNAAFMAAAVGRLTGRPGVCLVTSDPGVGNIVTGAATAIAEGDPMVAIGGAVPPAASLKQVRRTLDAVANMRPVTKYSASIDSPGEVVANAFRAATAPRSGAAVIAFPRDVQRMSTTASAPPMLAPPPPLGAAPTDATRRAADLIRRAGSPVLLLGLGVSEPRATAAVPAFLKPSPMPIVGTFQGAGVVSREPVPLPFGRIGLFRNQPGDRVVGRADVVVRVGCDPVEYGPGSWNAASRARIIHVDEFPCDLDNHDQPYVEHRGSIKATLEALAADLGERTFASPLELWGLRAEREALQNPPAPKGGTLLIHPLSCVVALRRLVDDDTIIASDMGSRHIWTARHFFEFEPRKLLFSNVQQTIGVGLPWAMAASLLNPGKKIVATVGDGGFLYSSMELEKAVRL